MNLELVRVNEENKQVLDNLMQLYLYDLSEVTKCDVDEDGKYTYHPVEENDTSHKKEPYPYLIKKDGKYMGFALVDLVESEFGNYFIINEFFILKKYRKQGLGKAAAHKIFNSHRGQWEVRFLESDETALGFWRSVVFDYTSGSYLERGYDNARVVHYFSS